MSNLAFDANKELKSGINSLMTTVGTNGLCIPIAVTYKALVGMINAVASPVGMFKGQIMAVMNNNDIVNAMKDIHSTLSILNSALPPSVNLTIDKKTLYGLDLFSKICIDFNDILPNIMKEYIDDGIEMINDGMEELMDFSYPDEISSLMMDAEEFLKENALSDALGEATKTLLSPLKMYRDFIKSTGIIQMLKRLQKFEKCMTNPKTCNRPKKEFMFTDKAALQAQYGNPNKKVYNSQYYIDLFAINLKGEVLLSKINKTLKTTEKNMVKTMNKLDRFKQPLIK